MTTTVVPLGRTPDPARIRAEDPTPLRAVHTPNFPALLRQLGASLLVTTNQTGKLVTARDEGEHINTHSRAFQAPMGLALDGDRPAVGTAIQVWGSAQRSRARDIAEDARSRLPDFGIPDC